MRPVCPIVPFPSSRGGVPEHEANVAQLVVRLICNQTVGGRVPPLAPHLLLNSDSNSIEVTIHHARVQSDAKGKAARLLGGIASIVGALILLLSSLRTPSPLNWVGMRLPVPSLAERSPFEARAGWCIVRAIGINTALMLNHRGERSKRPPVWNSCACTAIGRTSLCHSG